MYLLQGGEHTKILTNGFLCIKALNISETRQDKTKVTTEEQLEVLYAVSTGA